MFLISGGKANEGCPLNSWKCGEECISGAEPCDGKCNQDLGLIECNGECKSPDTHFICEETGECLPKKGSCSKCTCPEGLFRCGCECLEPKMKEYRWGCDEGDECLQIYEKCDGECHPDTEPCGQDKCVTDAMEGTHRVCNNKCIFIDSQNQQSFCFDDGEDRCITPGDSVWNCNSKCVDKSQPCNGRCPGGRTLCDDDGQETCVTSTSEYWYCDGKCISINQA